MNRIATTRRSRGVVDIWTALRAVKGEERRSPFVRISFIKTVQGLATNLLQGLVDIAYTTLSALSIILYYA